MFDPSSITIDDYLQILCRHARLLTAAAVVGALLGYGVTLRLQKSYTSTALVVIEQQRVADTLVKPVVVEELDQRLATMQEQILSRTELRSLIERYRLFAKDRGRMSDDQLVARLRRWIVFTPVMPQGEGGVIPAFRISVTGESPAEAHQICSEISHIFTTQDLKAREEFAQDTTEFLRRQLETARNKLQEQDAKLAAFRTVHKGQLPGDEPVNINLLGGRSAQLHAVTEDLNRALQEKENHQAQLTRELALWRSHTGLDRDDLRQRVAQSEAELVAMQTKYTPDFPDVIKAKANLAKLKSALEGTNVGREDPSAAPVAGEPEEVARLRGQLRRLELLIATKSAEQQQLRREVAHYESLLQLSPELAQQYAQVSRDHEATLGEYNNLAGKYSESQMAASLEHNRNGEQFRIVDAASLPAAPSFPNRVVFAAGGLGGGLGMGFLMAFLMELRNKGLRTKEDVEHYLQLPALLLIPELTAEAAKFPRITRRRNAVRD